MHLPPVFIQSIEQSAGFDKAAFEKVHENGQQVTSVRLNPGKILNTQYSIFNAPQEKVPWNSNGFYLQERPSFTADPFFHAGAYYVQEASSMFVEQAIKQTVDLSRPVKVLDLCAAPGGKSTLIQSMIGNASLLVSNEVIRTRVTILAENITKWGAANVIVTNNDAKDFQRLPGYFDVIVVDAPCSGSGLFRKDPGAVSEWSEQNVQLCSQRQQRILADVLPALKEDGVLIYSTCSYSAEEDEAIADWLLKSCGVEGVRLKVEHDWGIVETQSEKEKAHGYRFYPDKVKGEGFFIAAFRKLRTGNGEWKLSKHKARSEKFGAKESGIVKPYLENADNFFFIKQKEEVIALPKVFEEDLAAIQNALYIKKAGVKLGTVIRSELVPDHELAVSTIINPALNAIDVDEAMALQYLRKQDITVDTNRKGWALIQYRQLPLGWVKVLPGRINNYYPKEWRILNK